MYRAASLTNLSGEKLLIGTCGKHMHTFTQANNLFLLVRCCLLENNNASTSPSFKPGNQPLEGQSDQIDL